jgi:hypothetical protein
MTEYPIDQLGSGVLLSRVSLKEITRGYKGKQIFLQVGTDHITLGGLWLECVGELQTTGNGQIWNQVSSYDTRLGSKLDAAGVVTLSRIDTAFMKGQGTWHQFDYTPGPNFSEARVLGVREHPGCLGSLAESLHLKTPFYNRVEEK